MSQRRHLELDTDEAQLLDRPRSPGVAIADERDRLAVELGEDLVERVLQHRRVAVVVLGRDDHVAVGGVDLLRPACDLGRVFAAAARRRGDLLVEGHRVVAQVDRLDAEILAPGQASERPAGGFLAEATLPCGAEDQLDAGRLRCDGATLARQRA